MNFDRYDSKNSTVASYVLLISLIYQRQARHIRYIRFDISDLYVISSFEFSENADN